MYLWIKLMKESQVYWREHFNSPETPWTAEFAMGWRLSHRPFMSLVALLEMTIECGVIIYILVLIAK